MTQAIAMLLPALVAVSFFNHLHRGRLAARELVTYYGLFALLINISLYAIVLYLFDNPSITFTDQFFIKYAGLALVFAVIFPLAVNLATTSIGLEVKKNEHPKK